MEKYRDAIPFFMGFMDDLMNELTVKQGIRKGCLSSEEIAEICISNNRTDVVAELIDCIINAISFGEESKKFDSLPPEIQDELRKKFEM